MRNALNFLTVLLLLSNVSFGQGVPEQIDSIMKKYHEENPEVGISLGFIQNEVEYYTAYGKLSKNSPIKINKNSVFEIASITKILTTNLIAQAVEEDKLNLEDFIDAYLPQSYVLQKNLRNKIKISDLASHQSGLPDLDFGKLMEQNPKQPVSSVTQEDLSNLVNDCSDLLDYGTYRYSTIGYTLLGQILETVYNKSYDEVIREKIINPLQLTNTLTKDFKVTNSTIGHNSTGEEQELLEWHITASAGLVKSTASDLTTYLKALLSSEGAISKAAILSENVFYEEGRRVMGLGLNIMRDENAIIYLKSGDSMGQSSILCYSRAKKWGIVILLDQRNSPMRQQLLNEIYETVLR